MTGEQIRLLSDIKKLVKERKRELATRKDCDCVQDILDIGISVEDAWKEILYLKSHHYYVDTKPNYSKRDKDALTFKKTINGYLVYIKLKIEKKDNNELAVCLSFHIDHR